ncbi:hypothetical protein SAMN05421690_101515 [Nitrosomonas sp. Nm51]|uniref:hypothetical protein n=1 Tax=Nitrosomonas sp. Nm51 TaxID=133720 RepID=UPI0008BBB84B|nr:hypothetical protein [Nitrosomonas sp. Nm51]SER26081.1 hypothetical protein SAMN05421690_101515 [Nitrosomonas sp. Nm51]
MRDEPEIREKIVRVEEELKHQRELMIDGFNRVDKRFEVMTTRIDRFMIWSFAGMLTVGGIVIAVIKYLP